MSHVVRGLLLLLCVIFTAICAIAQESAGPRKIVLIAGKKSHGPGAHDYERTMRLFKVMLDNSNVADRVQVEVHEQGWPADERTLDSADTIVFYSDGRDGDKYVDVPFVEPSRRKLIQKQIDRGCGMLTMHFSTFVNDEQGKSVLDWVGGYFDWEDDAGKANWYSKISQIETLELAAREHPISRGVPRMVQLRDEVYWKMRFLPEDKRLQPIWRAIDVFDDKAGPSASTVAWAIERKDGGRGFGTSVGHAYRLWQDEGIRKLFLNAIVWTAKAEVPEHGVEARFYSDDEVNQAMAGIEGNAKAIVELPLKVLLFTGNKHHAWHNGEASTARVKAALEADPRMKVQVSHDIEELATLKLNEYQAIVLNNYANWHDPRKLSDAAKEAFLKYLGEGGGLVVIHFANGAFHFSLPEAGESDWPEYRKIVRRVWDHHGHGGAKSAHDAFGQFTVNPTAVSHPISAGLKAFDVADELYYHQAGEEPIEPLLTAKSKNTNREEPLAWAYDYQQARVFQTLLGHSEKTYDSYEPREMLRRAVAWVARRKVIPLAVENEKLALAVPPAKETLAEAVKLVPGKFGQALDARVSGLLLEAKAEQVEAPLTVECWAKLSDKQGFNIVVASEPKSSPSHWELYSYAGSGVCSVYMPGRGGEFKTSVDICDDRWHYIGFSFENEQLQIYVDGKLAGEGKLSPLAAEKDASNNAKSKLLGIGRLAEGGIGCAGHIDDVRLTRGAKALEAIPDKPLQQEDSTLLLISCDDAQQLQKLQASALKLAGDQISTVAAVKPDHWGIEGVGFKWREEDSRDDRWKETQIGPFLASSLPLGTAGGTVAKGLSIRIGDKQQATVCYDTATGKLRAAWSGGFLKFTPARFGLIMPPLIDGEPQFLATDSPSWGAKEFQYVGLQQIGQRVVLKHLVDGISVEESPWAHQDGNQVVFSRQIEVGPSEHDMVLRVAGKLEPGDSVELREKENQQVGVLKSAGRTIVFFSPNATARWSIAEESELRLTLPAHKETVSLPVVFGAWEDSDLASFATHAKATKFGSLIDLKQSPAKLNWPAEITTAGVMAKDEAAYVVDTITIPFENPYKALFFTSGHDAVSPDTMAVCTVHGDVWLVSGIGERLTNLRWKRYATGLFQPLGIVAKPDGIYVLGRDQITRLHDQNGDGEADFYECFCNRLPTSSGGHDYTTCLETDELGNFYFITAHQGIWRLSADGKQLDNIASGLRNPNGLGVGPGPIITVAPQEGNWTPASYIGEAKAGDYFGFGGPKVTPERPLGWTQPLCFIPRRRDNSSGGQVWVTSDRWGPLKNQMLHFSYGQCRPMLVLREVIAGQVQGGTVDLPQLFDSGAMRGRFNPHDGQLYVSGLRGWTTAATQDGCLQRVRYTGLPVNLPVQFRTLQNGVAITFTEPLNREAVEDLNNYHLEQWNYRYAESYGSHDFKVSDPKQEGHDEVRVESATLLADGRTVFLEIADLQPVHQLTIGFALTSATGAEIRHTIAYTIHKISEELMDPNLLHRTSQPGRLTQAEESLLKPGLLARFSQKEALDVRPLRMAAFYVGQQEPPTQLLSPGQFEASLSGYLKLPLKSDVRLSVVGNGKVAVTINGREVLQGAGRLEEIAPAAVKLHGGYNAFSISYESPVDGDAQLRLFWEGADFAREPIPPTAFAYQGDDAELLTFDQLRRGKQIVAQRRCHACHSPVGNDDGMGQSYTLQEMSERLQLEWIATFLLDPSKLTSHATMPQIFQPSEAEDRQKAADISKWISKLNIRPKTPPDSRPNEAELVDQGMRLYEQLNCLACHRFTPPEEADEFDRISLHFFNTKYRPASLNTFLQAAHGNFSFRLTAMEVEAIAAYLRATAEGKLRPPLNELATADSERGVVAFANNLCIRCHKLGESKVQNPRKLLLQYANLEKGCLADEPKHHGTAPNFDWTAEERTSVVAYLQKYGPEHRQTPLLEHASQLVETLRCAACHNRDGKSSTRLAVFSEESETGVLPEQLPDLTWAGEKLQTSWLTRQFAGKNLPARSWMKSRMPGFPKHAELLSKSLAAEHGLPPVDEPVEAPQPELVANGQLLTLKENLDCRQCHGIGSLEPTGDEKTKLAPGINFALVRDRLRPEYYRRFVLDPPRVDPSTRMVKLAADGRTTKVTSIYKGHAPQQFEAIWNYIQSLPSSPPKE